MKYKTFKVALVIPYFSPDFGGAENYILELAKRLQRDYGCDIFVITSNKKNPKIYLEDEIEGIKVYRLPITFTISNTPINLSWYFQIKRILVNEKPDIINAHTPVPFMADIAARAAGSTPFLLTIHAASLYKRLSPITNLVLLTYNLFIARGTLKRASSIGTVSDFVKSSLPNFVQDKCTSLYNSINLNDIPKKNVKRHANRLVFIGSLNKTHSWKGLSEILKAFSSALIINKNLELIVVGDGDAKQDYLSESEKLGISKKVKYVGHIVGPEKYHILKSAAAVIIYPTTSNDALPTILLESWGSNTPVIASNIGVLSTIIKKNFNGILLKPRNCVALSEAIIKLLNDSAMQKKLAKNGNKEIYDTYNWSKQAKVTYDLLLSMTKVKICIIHNIIAPYRLAIFELISKQVDLTVIFCKTTNKDRQWSTQLDSYTFKYKILNSISIGPIIFNRNFFRILWRTKFDAVITSSDPEVAYSTLVAILILKLKRKRLLIWAEATSSAIHYFPNIAYNKLYKLPKLCLSIFVNVYRKLTYTFADGFIAFSQASKDFLTANNVSGIRITTTAQVIPLNQLPKPSRSFKRDGKTVLYIGALSQRKGISDLIEAFMDISDKDARLQIAGAGPEESKLKNKAESDNRIHFTGYVDGQEKADLYASSDIFVLPTLHDVWGLVINEAIHYGLAVICTDAAGAIEIINECTGLIVPPRDVVALRDAMLSLFNNPDILSNMKAHNLNRADVSDVANSVNGFIESINSLGAYSK